MAALKSEVWETCSIRLISHYVYLEEQIRNVLIMKSYKLCLVWVCWLKFKDHSSTFHYEKRCVALSCSSASDLQCHLHYYNLFLTKKGKVFPYSLLSVGPGADPGVQAVSPQVTWSESRHRPGSRLLLLSARPAVTSVAFTRWRYL